MRTKIVNMICNHQMNRVFYLILFSLVLISSTFSQVDESCEQPVMGLNNLSLSSSTGTFSSPISTDIYVHSGLFDLSNQVQSKVLFEISSVKAYVQVDFGDNYPWGEEEYQVDITSLNLVTQVLTLTGLNNTTLSPAPPSSILLSASKPEYTLVLDLTSEMLPNSQLVPGLVLNSTNQIAAVSIQPDVAISQLGNGLTPGNEQSVADKLRFSLCYKVEYKVTAPRIPTALQQIVVNAPEQINTSKRYTFKWFNADNIWYPYYELQLVRLFNNKNHSPTSQEDLETTIDWSRALSFILPENRLTKEAVTNVYSKELTVSEFTGYYAWRIRPIGSSSEGGIANNANWGSWDKVSANYLAQGTTINLNSLSDLGTTAFVGSVFFFRDPDEAEERNTIYSRVFTEGGKTHEGMNYADGLLKSRQSQSYFPSNSEHKTVITQQFYDHVGRSSISTLPVPTKNTLSGYQERFAKDAVTQDLYTVDNFDNVVDREETPDPMTLKGANPSETDYYSEDGSDPYVDDAQGYPFSISRYSNDGLDNVEQQSGVGKRHMIGDITTGLGRTTRKNYTSDVSADELIRIFGAEAPDNTTVTKEITTDPNGTQSVSYIDKTGKLLATCLSFNSDLNNALTDLDGTTAAFPVVDFMKASQLTKEGFVSTKRILFTEDVASFQIDYTPDGCNGFTVCGETLYCDFELTLFVANIENPTVNLIPAGTATTLLSSLCSLPTPAYNINLALPAGDYIVKKTLIAVDNGVGGSPVQTFIDNKIAATESALYVYHSLVTSLLANLDNDNSTDFSSAMTCVNNFVSASAQLGMNPPLASIQSLIDNLETCLTDQSTGLGFDMTDFDFSSLASIDLTIVSNLTLDATVSPQEIVIDFEDCGAGIPSMRVEAEMNVLIPPCIAEGSGLYLYRGTQYVLPPFLEYFADVVLNDLRNSAIEQFMANNGGATPTQSQVLTEMDLIVAASYSNYADLTAMLDAIFPGYDISAANINDYLNGTVQATNDNDFNKMIWHMLNDQYYCGQLVWEDGSTGGAVGYHKILSTGSIDPAVFDPNPSTNSTDNTVQYDCKEVWDCWKTCVTSISSILSLNHQTIDPFQAIEGNDPNGGGTMEDDFETNIPWLLSLFLGDDPFGGFQNDPNITDITASDQTFDNIPALFLECTGYRIARIIDPRIVYDGNSITFGYVTTDHHEDYEQYINGTAPAGSPISPHLNGSTYPTINYNTLDMPMYGSYLNTVPSSINQTKTHSSATRTSEIEEYFLSRNSDPLDEKEFPLTYNPVFAFKYYEYYKMPVGYQSSTQLAFSNYNTTNGTNLTIGSGTFSVPTHYISVERELSYPYNGVQASNPPFCDEPRVLSSSGHDQWPCGERHEFMKRIISSKELTIDPNNFDNPNDLFDGSSPIVLASPSACSIAVQPYYTDGSLTTPTPQDNPLARSCQNACESRRVEFKEAIIKALETRCYTIGGCSDCPGHISAKDVDKLVANLVFACQEQCSVHTDITNPPPCQLTNGTVIQACDIIYGTPCQKYLIEQVKSWRPVVDFPSLCNPSDPYPTGHLEQAYNAADEEDCDNSGDFSQQGGTTPASKVKVIQQAP